MERGASGLQGPRAAVRPALVRTSGDTPWSRWHLAYAHALAGLPIEAMEDLPRANAQVLAAPGAVPPPGWVKAIDAFTFCDAASLSDLSDRRPDERALASYLAFQLVRGHSSHPLVTRLGTRCLAVTPDCMRVFDDLAQSALTSPATIRTTFCTQTPARLARVRGLSPQITTGAAALGEKGTPQEAIAQSGSRRSKPTSRAPTSPARSARRCARPSRAS